MDPCEEALALSIAEDQERIASLEAEIELADLNLATRTRRQRELKAVNELVEWRLRILTNTIKSFAMSALIDSLHKFAATALARQNEERYSAKVHEAVRSAINILERMEAKIKNATEKKARRLKDEIMNEACSSERKERIN